MSERSKDQDVAGPFILWLNYGAYEGWKPQSFPSVRAALEADKYCYQFIITKPATYQVVDTTEP